MMSVTEHLGGWYRGNRWWPLPVYWLLDRKGRLVTTRAPRPSEGLKLRRQIDKLLE